MCCCGVLYALTPPRGSASPPLSLSTSQGLRPPPRESISQENCPPSPAPPQPSTSTPSLKVIHSLSVDTSCCLLRPGPTFPPKIRRKIRLGDLAAKGAQARWRPSVPFVPRQRQRPPATHRGVRRARGSDPGLDTSREDDLVLASRTCSAMSMAAVAFEVFYLLDGTKTDDAGR